MKGVVLVFVVADVAITVKDQLKNASKKEKKVTLCQLLQDHQVNNKK